MAAVQKVLFGILFISFLALLVSGCIEIFEVEAPEVTDRLVVDGRITTLPPPYQLRLTRSAAYATDLSGLTRPVRNATIRLCDTDGNCEEYMPTARAGLYATSPDGMQGEVGKSYYIEIETEQGENYRSNTETIVQSPPIQNVYTEFRKVQESPERYGWIVLLQVSDPSDEQNFYRWETVSTYPLNNRCFKHFRDFDGLNILSDELFDGGTINDIQTKIVPYDNVSKYLVDVEQYSLSAEAFDFYRQIKEQTEATGSIFDPPPSFIRGNVENLNDPDLFALGFFMAHDVSTNFVVVERGGVPFPPPLPANQLPPDEPLYCGTPCDPLCEATGGICGDPPCPPTCDTIPLSIFQAPENWPDPHISCDP